MCDNCTRVSQCGFCASTRRCSVGSATGPSASAGTYACAPAQWLFIPGSCACAGVGACSSCVQRSECEWCASGAGDTCKARLDSCPSSPIRSSSACASADKSRTIWYYIAAPIAAVFGCLSAAAKRGRNVQCRSLECCLWWLWCCSWNSSGVVGSTRTTSYSRGRRGRTTRTTVYTTTTPILVNTDSGSSYGGAVHQPGPPGPTPPPFYPPQQQNGYQPLAENAAYAPYPYPAPGGYPAAAPPPDYGQAGQPYPYPPQSVAPSAPPM